MSELFVIFGGITAIICANALLRFVTARAPRGPQHGETANLLERMGEVERRLTDIQDILLAIDEKLERSSNTNLT